MPSAPGVDNKKFKLYGKNNVSEEFNSMISLKKKI